MRRGTAKDALARLRWKDDVGRWSEVRIIIRHRGAPRDEKPVSGSALTRLGTSFFEVDGETQIPYHRILRIYRGDELVYDRGSPSEKTA
ncbi:MAG TPA: RNA repair domain-containing protein [Candidatus Thermoplasmatota archaeon]|nr:RNA repair domain-containing protein [Candidatus Thermoplasmatota archaeon]